MAWRLTNTGTLPIQLLKLEVRFLDAKGKDVAEPKISYANSSQQAPLQVGKYSLISTIALLPKSYHHYEVNILEVR